MDSPAPSMGDFTSVSRHADEGPGEASILSGCCSHSAYDHPPAASRQISDAAGPAEYPPCPATAAHNAYCTVSWQDAEDRGF